jgi:hypothetical protein
LPASENLSYAGSLYEAAKGADAAVILTDWKEFAKIDLVRLKQALLFPIVIDGRNLYDPHVMLENGFTYVSVGRPTNYPVQKRHGEQTEPMSNLGRLLWKAEDLGSRAVPIYLFDCNCQTRGRL